MSDTPERRAEVGAAPTVAQLKAEIDSGQTGEKVGFPDPAAAPLGTDDEAAGEPPTPAQRRLAQRSAPRAPYRIPSLDGRVAYAGFVAIAFAVVLIAAFLAS